MDIISNSIIISITNPYFIAVSVSTSIIILFKIYTLLVSCLYYLIIAKYFTYIKLIIFNI